MTRAAVVACLAWMALVATAVGLQSWTGKSAATCMFKHFTGCPCLTCGGTRAGVALAHGDFLGALAWNPLVAGLLAFGPIMLTADWALSRRRVARGHWSGARRTAAWIIGTAVVSANWGYVIWHGN